MSEENNRSSTGPSVAGIQQAIDDHMVRAGHEPRTIQEPPEKPKWTWPEELFAELCEGIVTAENALDTAVSANANRMGEDMLSFVGELARKIAIASVNEDMIADPREAYCTALRWIEDENNIHDEFRDALKAEVAKRVNVANSGTEPPAAA